MKNEYVRILQLTSDITVKQTSGRKKLNTSQKLKTKTNNLSKYAYEIMRSLLLQTCILSEKAANEEFHGLFCQRCFNGHIPADRRMEYLVKEVKKPNQTRFQTKQQKMLETDQVQYRA